jgi:hypothetical protein
VLFELFMMLNAYLQTASAQSLYLFFHEIGGEGQQRYPLFCAEVSGAANSDTVTLRSVRNEFMLNTPAVNSFEFDNVLTTPRACLFEEATQSLFPIEQFLQAKYSVPDPFLLGHGFTPMVKEKLPDIRFRVALQAVGEEDRRILDYSGLLTNLDEGAGRKFIDMVGQYVGGNVKDTTDDVAKTYGERYPHKSVDRLVHPAIQIPLPLNEPQKRILLAAENPANRVIVVDGPPGTGKSHTITALIYQATLNGKSVLVTSHKQQALDVIDSALTEQFKSVHPNAKPSVLRLTSPVAGGSRTLNDLQNTLSNPVIAAANQRHLAGNPDAVSKDRERLLGQIDASNNAFWGTADSYPEFVGGTFELAMLHETMFGSGADAEAVVVPRLDPAHVPDAGCLAKAAPALAAAQAKVPLAALVFLSERRHEMPELLKRCDRMHGARGALDPSLLSLTAPVPEQVASFAGLLDELATVCKDDQPLPCVNGDPVTVSSKDCCSLDGIKSYADLCTVVAALQAISVHERKFLGRLRRDPRVDRLRQDLQERFAPVSSVLEASSATDVAPTYAAAKERIDAACARVPWLRPDYLVSGFETLPPASLGDRLRGIASLQYHGMVSLLAGILGRSVNQTPLREVRAKVAALRQLKDCCAMADGLEEVARAAGIDGGDLPALYNFIMASAKLLTALAHSEVASLADLCRAYAPVLTAAGATPDDLRSFGGFADATGKTAQAIRYMELHSRLSRHPDQRPPSRQLIETFFDKTDKLLDIQMDARFKGLQNHSMDVARIVTAVLSGLRISENEARVLFSCLTCVIAEPSMVSRHLPMVADLVDYLIIDEASQVSIADSISLMLRAKQVIVFGDELQYGAVAAMNVSERYAAQYFKDILRDYALDMNQALSDKERDEIARDASRNPDEENEQSSPCGSGRSACARPRCRSHGP